MQKPRKTAYQKSLQNGATDKQSSTFSTSGNHTFSPVAGHWGNLLGHLLRSVRGSRGARVTGEGGCTARETLPMAPAARAPRMSQFVVALCVSLRLAGKSLRKIATHRLVKKRDGKSPTQQAVAKAVKKHKSLRRSAPVRWKGRRGSRGREGGRR